MHEDGIRTIDELQAHASFAKGLARSLLHDDQAADDVVQDAFMVALEHPPERHPRAWLATVTRRLSLNRLRSTKRRAAREDAVAASRPTGEVAPDLAEHRETVRSVMDAVLALAAPYQSVVLLRFYEGLTPTEIAARLGQPAATVRTRLKRALEQLRGRLDAEHGGDRRAWCLALLPIAELGDGTGAPPDDSMSTDAATSAAALGGALVGKKLIAVAAGVALLAVFAGSAFVGARDSSSGAAEDTAQVDSTTRRRDTRRRTDRSAPSTAQKPAAAPTTGAATTVADEEPQPQLVKPGTARLTGRVIDEKTGAGMANVAVYLMRGGLAKPAWDQAQPHTHTDAHGRFVCPGIAAGQHYVGARHPERLYAIQPWAKATAEEPQPVELLLRVPQQITGRVIVPGGHSLADVRVYAETANYHRDHGLWWDREARDGRVASDGTFVIDGLPGSDHAVRATLREGAVNLRAERAAVRAGGPPIELVLVDRSGPRTTVRLRFEAPGGRTITAMTLRSTSHTWDGSSGRGTDEIEGDTFVEHHRDSLRCLWIEPLSYVDDDGKTHRVAPIATPLSKTHGIVKVVTLEPPVVLEGRVVGPDGVGVAGVRVLASPTAADLVGFGGRESVVTSDDGSFRFDGLAPGDHTLQAWPTAAFLRPPRTAARPGTPALITLRAAAEPVVTVIGPDDEPLEGADVELFLAGEDPNDRDSEYDAETDELGIARFESVAPGRTYTLVVDPAGRTHSKRRVANWRPVDTTVRVAAGRSLGGVLVDEAGTPIPDATIELVIDGTGAERDRPTDAEGRFRFDGLESGTVKLFVCLTDEVRTEETPLFAATIGQTSLKLVVDAGVVLRGTMTNWGDRGILVTRGVRFIVDGPEPQRVIRGEHDRERFWFAGLPEGATGTLLIGPDPGGYVVLRRGVETDAGELEVELVRGRRVKGTVKYPEGISEFAARVHIWSQAIGGSFGGHTQTGAPFELRGLPGVPGTVHARLRVDDKEYRASAAEEPGVPLELVLREVEE